jgi:hypothetical protein
VTLCPAATGGVGRRWSNDATPTGRPRAPCRRAVRPRARGRPRHRRRRGRSATASARADDGAPQFRGWTLQCRCGSPLGRRGAERTHPPQGTALASRASGAVHPAPRDTAGWCGGTGPSRYCWLVRRHWPLAILLAGAAALAWVGGTPALSVAVIAVILLNAGFAFVQEMQAERAVDALAAFLPAKGERCPRRPTPPDPGS